MTGTCVIKAFNVPINFDWHLTEDEKDDKWNYKYYCDYHCINHKGRKIDLFT